MVKPLVDARIGPRLLGLVFRVKRWLLAASLAPFVAFCGASMPTNPSGSSSTSMPAVPGSPGTLTLTGVVTATNGGHTLGGVTVTIGGLSGTTDATGQFSLTFAQSAGTLPVVLSGPGLVKREAWVGASVSRTLALDAIVDGGGFDLDFYRQLVRNSADGGLVSLFETLKRRTAAPMFYVQTIDLAGAAVPAEVTTHAARILVESVAAWTDARFISTVEAGPDTREGVAGWVTVKWYNPTETSVCGRAEIAGSRIWLNYLGSGCRCGSTMAATVIAHEVGHSLGFHHVDNPNEVMNRAWRVCTATPSARERYHAAIAYSRPAGNRDPDTDPSSTVLRTTPVVVID